MSATIFVRLPGGRAPRSGALGTRRCFTAEERVAWLVELASGQPFDDYVRARLLAPLGMEHTGRRPR